MALTPYVVGQWVRDERFYGREALIGEILEGQRNCLWILGTRRIGKTSILKQLERTTATDPNPRYVPIYWDFQGSESEEDLHEGFRDALYDAADRLDDLGIGLDEVDADDLFVALGRLRRALRRRDLSLLLLGDEVEELVAIHAGAPRLLRRLQRAFQAHEGIRTVLASTIRLWNLADTEGSTGLFLNGFTPPLPVRSLEDRAARDLIRQVKLPIEARPTVDDQTVEAIRLRCNNHPYLLQLVSERLLELGDLEAAVEAIATDPMVSFFFDADLAMLGENERRIIQVILEQDEATTDAIRAKLREASASTSPPASRAARPGGPDRKRGLPLGELVLPSLARQPRHRQPGAGLRRCDRGLADGAHAADSRTPRRSRHPGRDAKLGALSAGRSESDRREPGRRPLRAARPARLRRHG